MSTDAEPIQLAQRLDFESKHFSEGSVLRGPISDPLLKPGAFSDPTKDHADVEQRREAHLAEVKAKAGAEVEHVSIFSRTTSSLTPADMIAITGEGGRCCPQSCCWRERARRRPSQGPRRVRCRGREWWGDVLCNLCENVVSWTLPDQAGPGYASARSDTVAQAGAHRASESQGKVPQGPRARNANAGVVQVDRYVNLAPQTNSPATGGSVL